MIQSVADKIDKLFDDALAKYKGYLPFGGKYLLLAKGVVDACLPQLLNHLREYAHNGSYEGAVEDVINFIRANVRLPIYLIWLTPFEDQLLGQLRSYLLANKDLFIDKLIGDAPPV
jgi:hypothetical protein